MKKVAPKSRAGKDVRVLACKVCRCTNEAACRPCGCSWIKRWPIALCSTCVFFIAQTPAPIGRAVCQAAAIPIITPKQAIELLRARGWDGGR